MATAPTRLRALVIGALFVATACTTGGGASPTPAPTTAASAASTPQPSATPAPVSLSWLAGSNVAIQTRIKALAAAYTAKHPNVTFKFETLPDGPDGDSALKTRLATGEMTDLFWYNSGSLLQTLNPTQTVVDISGEPFIANIQASYLPTVSTGTATFGVPSEPAMAGGILYNKKVYAANGVTVPKTWAEFAANNDKLKAAGIPPVAATFAGADTWTSQILVLADYCNVEAAVPGFAEKYTNNQAHYADTPAAAAGFKHIEEAHDKGWFQKDFGAATFDDGLNALAEGKVAGYPMLTFALGRINELHPDKIEDIGFFGLPGDDAAKNCATIWMPSATYISKSSKNVDVAKDFLGFIASVEGTDVLTKALAPSGPYVIKGSTLPADTMAAVKDIQAYLEGNAAGPALEFLSPVKGPGLQQITVAVATGQNTGEEGATLADQDVEKQAKQLGLPGW